MTFFHLCLKYYVTIPVYKGVIFDMCLFSSSYRQAQATVLEALPLLKKNSIATKRPDDYFAEMAKSDQHMQKVSCFFITNLCWLQVETKISA